MWFLAAIGALVIANRILTFATPTRETPKQTSTPQLVQVERDLGEVWEVEGYPCKIVLHNSGDKPVQVSGLAGECTCVQVLAERIEILPRSQASIPLKVDLTREGANDGSAVREVGIKVHGVWSENGSGVHNVAWVLRVRIHRHLVFDPPMLGLGEDVVAGMPGAERRVIISAERPIASLQVSSSPRGWETRLSRIGDTRYQLTTIPVRDEPGSFKETIVVDGLTREGQPLPRQRLNVEGYALPLVRAYPEETDVGAIKPRQSYSCIIHIKTDKGTVSKIEPGEAIPGVALEPACREEDGRWRLKITIVPTESAYRLVTGKFKVQLDGDRWHDVEYRLRWHRADQ